jgi:hypothetical protein
MDCVFYEVFTGRSPVGITRATRKTRNTSGEMDSLTEADVAYLEAKAHQAVVDYYGAGNAPHLGMPATNVVKRAAFSPMAAFSKAGQKLTANLNGRTGINSASSGTTIAIAKDAMGKTRRIVINR